MDNETLRRDEMEALSAIYCDDWILEDPENRVYTITLREPSSFGKSHDKFIQIQFRFPLDYPLNAAPLFTISAPWMSRHDKQRLISAFNEIHVEHRGESVVYLCIEKAREFLANDTSRSEVCDENKSGSNEEVVDGETLLQSFSNLHVNTCKHNHDSRSIIFYHGHPIVDRGSTFQAHLAAVDCLEQMREAKALLLSKREISTALHNISAYRIAGGPHNSYFQDCDDDGEKAAGRRLLHLLEILEVKNVLVVVSRWFGGILLGPDRFKHINNVARELLQERGYINNVENKETAGKKKKGK
ncbi:protein IMPACT-like protein [Dinothrombium tinctorium]|uniref:Protein IMPACT-like protein n=1 Tax=Dinothrombium tinctorium TaxID=1965070 RepID=A0A3S3RPJ7_9ACAR|nr:protein IMPACT-like protein [Dinothrombium tinctorium]